MSSCRGVLALWIVVIGVWGTRTVSAALFPSQLRGDWYSWEDGRDVFTTIYEDEVEGRGRPVGGRGLRKDLLQYVFQHHSRCLACCSFRVRSWNVLDRREGPCVPVDTLLTYMEKWNTSKGEGGAGGEEEGGSWRACDHLQQDQKGSIMFRLDPSPLNCRSALHGLYHFAWQNRFSFTGECDHPEALLRACQQPGSQFMMESQLFSLHYKKCEGIKDSFDATVVYSCLGDWQEGKNHYFVVANTRESRRDKQYRCFVKSREDDLYLGHSLTPECSILSTPENSPVRLRLTHAKHEEVSPGCLLPHNLTGKWQSTGPGEPEVLINSTHLQETSWRGYTARTSLYVCLEHRGNRYLTARLSVEGCQTEYVCWEFVPRHHNIVRYRVSWALITRHFQVCDYDNFRSGREWKYDTLIADNPDPISCPIGGRFTFGQVGPSPLTPRMVGGITSSPLDSYPCTRRLTDLAICDLERKWMVMDLDLCVSLNKDGHPLDFNSVVDYRLRCVGFWKENLMSYLVTHDPSDSVSRFRCWVYQQVSPTQMRLSLSVGAACGLHQTFLSSQYSQGAAVALNLTLSERIHDHCPMYYDDGKNPWQKKDDVVTVFRFASHGQTAHLGSAAILVTLATTTILLLL